MEFLESRIGLFDLYFLAETGELFVRYCFEREADAEPSRAVQPRGRQCRLQKNWVTRGSVDIWLQR
jgi:hypothetical protein